MLFLSGHKVRISKAAGKMRVKAVDATDPTRAINRFRYSSTMAAIPTTRVNKLLTA